MSAPVSGGSAPSWMPGGGRASSADRIDAVFGGGSVGVGGGWRPSNDDEPNQSFYFFSRDQQQQPEHERALFTPLMSRRAAGFPASETYSDTHIDTPLFLTELTHAVSVYELNMKAIEGTLSVLGSIINRYG